MKFKSSNQRKAVMASMMRRQSSIKQRTLFDVIEARRQWESQRIFGTNFYKLPKEEQDMIERIINKKSIPKKLVREVK